MRSKCKISVGFLFLLLLSVLVVTRSDMLIPLVLSITLHELGHVIMARICGIKMAEFKLDIFGAALSPTSISYSYISEILLCLGGPLFNYVTVTFAYHLPQSPFRENLIMASLALGTINLLPIFSFDGGRIFSSFLSLFLPPKAVINIMRLTSFFLIFTLWCFSVYLLLRRGASLATFIFSISLFAKIFLGQNLTTY